MRCANLCIPSDNPTSSLLHNCRYEPSLASIVPKFTKIYALPSPQRQPTSAYRDRHRRPHYRRFAVRRHVVRSLVRMVVQRRGLRYHPVQRPCHVAPHVRVAILVYRQPATRMAHKQMQQTNARQLWQARHHVARYQMAAATTLTILFLPVSLLSSFPLKISLLSHYRPPFC